MAWNRQGTLLAAPLGPAGGDLSGTYPNPGLAATIAARKTFGAGLTVNSQLAVGGGLQLPEATHAAPYGAAGTFTQPVVQVLDATNGSIGTALPIYNLTSNPWQPGTVCIYQRIDASANTVFVQASGGASIQGSASQVTLTAQWETVWLMATATAGVWRIVARYNPNSVDSGLVHLAGTETITGSKTFTATVAHQATTTFSALASFSGQVALSSSLLLGSATRSAAITLTTSSASVNECSAATAPFTITLPAAATGQFFIFKKTDSSANAVTIVPTAGGSTIDGAASVVLSSQNDTVILVGSGSNWDVVARQSDTGWQAVTLNSGVSATGTLRYRNLNGMINMQATVTVAIAAGSSSIIAAAGAIPAGHRPGLAANQRIGRLGGTAAVSDVLVGTDGSVTVTNPAGGAAATSAQFYVSYIPG